MKKKMDLQKIFRCIFLALAIVSMLIAIAEKVSAEELVTPQQIYDEFSLYHTQYTDEIFDLINSECPYWSTWIGYNNEYMVSWTPNKEIGLCVTSVGSSYAGSFDYLLQPFGNTVDENVNFLPSGNAFYGSADWATLNNRNSYQGFSLYSMYVSNGVLVFYRFTAGSSSYGWQTISNTNPQAYCLATVGINRQQLDNNNGIWGSVSYTSSFNRIEYSYCNYDGILFYTRSSSRYISSFSQNYIPTSVNSKFKIYSTFGSAGISDPILHIEYNDILFDAGYTYTSFTQYDLTFELDGETVVYSADSDQFPDDFFTAEYNSGFRVPYEYIYEMLSDQLFNFSDVSSVKLVQVDMTATAYPDLAQLGTPQTKTASTLCSLNLKGYDLAPEYDDDSPVEITDKILVYDQVVDSNDYINHSGQFNSANIPSWADMVTIIVYNDPVGQNFNAPFSCDLYINDDILKSFSFSGYTDPNYIITTSTGTVIDYDHLVLNKAYLSEFIIVSKLLDSADCVHFISGDYNGNGTWTTYDSYLFINQSYYQKLTIKGIGNLQSAVEAGSYYTKGLYTYVYSKLNSMAENSITYYTNSFTALQEQKSILGSINSGLLSVKDTISSGTDRIVTAIGAISSGGSSYNLPSLSSEIQRLFIPSLSWESIDFEEYIDSLGVLGLPFTSTNDILMAARSNYSPDFEIHINDFKPTILGETFTVFEDQDFSFNPRRIFSLEIWTTLQYLNAFALILGEAWFTYCHIFRREKNDC